MIHPYIYAGLPKAKMTYSEAYNYEKQRISEIFGISDFVTNKTRKRNYVWLRNILFYTLNKKHDISCTIIEELTSYDRTTALHSVNLTDTFIKTKDKEFMKYYDRFKDANVSRLCAGGALKHESINPPLNLIKCRK